MMVVERDAGWLTHPSSTAPSALLEHPAVVLRITPHGALLIHGTTTPRATTGRPIEPPAIGATPDADVFWVEPHTAAGTAMGLSQRTYFAKNGVVFVKSLETLKITGRCTPDVFLQLRRIAGF